MTLYSYVVDHDLGYSPNPYGDYCTLAHCKFKTRRDNIVELAKPRDWVVGTGGLSSASAGHGKLIYAMQVDEKMTLKQYFHDKRFIGRADNDAADANRTDRFVLISQNYFYFGANAIDIAAIPSEQLGHPFEKRGPGYRKDFTPEFISDFEKWLGRTYSRGSHGDPCG